MKQTLMFIAMMLFAVSALADCPDREALCDTATFGWQGTCFKNLLCKRCGPEHCPERPMFDTSPAVVTKKILGTTVSIPRKSVALLHGSGAEACRSGLVDIKWRPNGSSACSIPDSVAGVAGMADLAFGKSACVEHDVCYAMEGMNQEICDLMFLDNMRRDCDEYYYKHLGDRDAIKLLNAPGVTSCRTAAQLFYSGVKHGGANSFNPSQNEKELCEDVSGPPVLNTSLYLNGSGVSDRIGVLSTKGKSDKPAKIKVCLVNKTNQWKGLHFKESSGAKYIAKQKDQKSCGHYNPGKKTFYFWERSGIKMEQRVNGSPITLDLNGYAGYRIDLNWYKE